MGAFDWKPRDGWRHFAGEVGVIVLGVLIALTIGVIADSIRWRIRADEHRTSIKGEMAINAGVHEERTLIQPCVVRRLDQIDRLLRAARRSGRLPDIGDIGRPATRPLSSDSWELASGSEALLYFDSGEVSGLSVHYSQSAKAADHMMSELLEWSTLRAIERAPGTISDDLLADLTSSVGRLRFLSFLNGIRAEQSLQFTKDFGVTPSYFSLFDKEEPRSKLLETVGARPICKPLLVDGKLLTA